VQSDDPCACNASDSCSPLFSPFDSCADGHKLPALSCQPMLTALRLLLLLLRLLLLLLLLHP
jgi:hypothetical protein